MIGNSIPRWALLAVVACISACADPRVSLQSRHAEDQAATPDNAVRLATSAQMRVSASENMPQAAAAGVFGFKPQRQFTRMLDAEARELAHYVAVAADDFNGDGRTDLIGLTDQNQIDLFLQRVDGTLALPLTFVTGSPVYSTQRLMTVDDFNQDGIADVAFDTVNDYGAGGGVGLLLSRRGGPPVYHQGYPPLADSSSEMNRDWVSLDVDGDGFQDIVVVRFGDHLILHGDGRGNFGREQSLDTVFSKEGLRELVVRDLNGDGLRDLVFLENPYEWLPGSVMVSYRKPQGGLMSPVEIHKSPVGSQHHLFYGDINGDRRDDAVIGYEIHLRNANGSFGEALNLATFHVDPSTPVLADFDGDGYTDLVNRQFEGFGTIPFTAVYLQRNGVLRALIRLDDPNNFGYKIRGHRQAYAVGDFNSDGCLDLAMAASYDGILFRDGENCIPLRHRTGGNLPPARR